VFTTVRRKAEARPCLLRVLRGLSTPVLSPMDRSSRVQFQALVRAFGRIGPAGSPIGDLVCRPSRVNRMPGWVMPRCQNST